MRFEELERVQQAVQGLGARGERRETRRAVVRRDRDGGAAQGERRGAREAVARVQQAVQGVGAEKRATGARETSDEGASVLVNDIKGTCIYVRRSTSFGHAGSERGSVALSRVSKDAFL